MHNFEPTLAENSMLLGKVSVLQMAKIENVIGPSGHTAGTDEQSLLNLLLDVFKIVLGVKNVIYGISTTTLGRKFDTL